MERLDARLCITVLPFPTLEHVDEPRVEAKTSPQSELFDPRGRQVRGWTNKLIWGDNKLILISLKIRYQVAVKVIDIFGNDTMTLVPVSVG